MASALTQANEILNRLGLAKYSLALSGEPVTTPIDATAIARVAHLDPTDVAPMVAAAGTAFEQWRDVPAPRRGGLIRLFGEQLREHKDALGRLVTLETGKILEEGRGEVQEMIDICDLAVGISRQLHGLTISSERPAHSMRETWHPLGVTGVITAFNFPVAVFSWNFALALVCGNPVIWKPSEETPLTALAVECLFTAAADCFGPVPDALLQLAVGGAEVGAAVVDNPGVAVVSATGSTGMGRVVGQAAAARFARCILELGGNNAMIVAPSADLKLAVPAIVFAAVGTAGQRCTTLRRLIVHDEIHDQVVDRLQSAYSALPIGDPLESSTLVGPLISGQAFAAMQAALEVATADGGRVFGGRRRELPSFPDAFYVEPALVEMPAQTAIVHTETFAPILYIMRYREFSDALALNNAVPQGLSSAVFTTDLREAEIFVSSSGSDCGIANVNIGPSGAEIGGAFGGEKATGGGREAGSDAWKGYMRRQTNTVNYSSELPLAQGITFDVDGGS